jgi:Family of unknown function (DUF6194)
MTADEITALVAAMPGVVVLTVDETDDAPEAWRGDTFFYYDPHGDQPPDRRLPFATVIHHDYEGFDTASDLDRSGVFRLSIAAGRDRFEELLGFPPAAYAANRNRFDYTALDRLLPHPAYAAQGYVAILNPGERTSAQARDLLTHAHDRAARRLLGRRGS